MSRNRDDNDAPWLAEVESDHRSSTSVPRGRLIGGITIFLLLLVLIVVGVYMVIDQKQDGASGTTFNRAEDAPLIAADPGPYKIKPDVRGGMQIDENGNILHDASNGIDQPGYVDILNGAEDPLTRPGQAPLPILPGNDVLPTIPPAAKPLPAVVIKPVTPVIRPVYPAPKALPLTVKPPIAAAKPLSPTVLPLKTPAVTSAKTGSGTGRTLQFGAFSTAAKADAVWQSLTARFNFLTAMGKRVEPVERGATTLYRLRATAVDAASAKALCDRVAAAGENCQLLP
jgi:cell division septation protein DedD